MEYLSPEARGTNQGKILCCQCGTLIEPNPANMCIGCLRTQVDITEGIQKQVVLYFCKGCERYLQPPAQWISCALESRELMAVCLKKLKGLNQVHLVDASFVWTEPHSKRIKVKLTVQKEVMGGAILQQVFVVEYVVNHQMCEICHRREAKDFWRAVVQVRQRVIHKKTFFYLEQLILKHRAHSNCLNVKSSHDGLDFFFAKKDDAKKLVDFFMAVAPCKYITSQHLLSHDVHNNTYNYKYSFSVEIAPVCKNDVVCLPVTLARSLGNIGQICICYRVTNSIHLIDPNTLQLSELTSQQYWRTPFQSLGSAKQLTEYTVMNVEHVADRKQSSLTSSEHKQRAFPGQGALSQKHVLANVWVVRSSELGITNSQIHCRTHMGHLFKPGDLALGLDLANINVNNLDFDKLKQEKIPDVVLVKKIYGDKASRHQKRKWKLKRLDLDMETDTSSINRDFDDFLEDLEEDVAYRQNVNVYLDREKIAVDTDENEEEFPHITLQEMLDELTLDATGEEGGPMLE